MKIRDFEAKIKGFPVFNLNDIRKIDPEFHRQQLTYWKDQGYINSLAGGYYILADQTIDESLLFLSANKIYEPSYISLESALAYYSIIPETVLGVTSVSSRKTMKFESMWGIMSFRNLQPHLMFGFNIVSISDNVKYKIAILEKAVLDYLYLHSEITSVDDFDTLRWNISQLLPLKDNDLVIKYLIIFSKKALENRFRILMEYLHA